MRAMQVTEHGQPLSLQTIPTPDIGADQMLVRVAACALNFGDLLLLKGTYQEKPPLPFTLGMELSGTIEKIGSDVTNLSVGQRVISYTGFGGIADYAAIPADICLPIPDSMDMIDAAAFPVGYGTAHLALDYRARMQAGERLLVLGASGGVGLTAVELGKLMGAEVIAVARNAEKLDIAKQAGADHLINSETDDIRTTVKALGGADVVYDPVGGDQFTAAMRATNPDGRLIPLGFASGTVPQIPANHLLVKNLTVIGYYWGGYSRVNPRVLGDSLATLLDWHEAGKIKPHVSNVLPLDQANEALDLLRTRKATGKVVVTVE
ncbi:NADPH:quinone oxidoreductase family protein [Amylibacter sp. IMCC11727]|uniref:NADPH:quinone oxidoreductase family protein n=1 Tax=Amylibacter sp. IMCC11727 TaxID=3039851 RepID=UPI00244E5623|nr:NADPH:quinone oxidoreductase family protein [Amylibacter sp. IMCC11727]WGI23035.1 NADPH:quinone oxidoreductase family protein [Amylibacter sp. IMCC11727]